MQAASFFLTYSVPSSMCFGWKHPNSFEVARPRCEVACVVCARKDWMENRFQAYMWKEATDSKTVGEYMDGPGETKLLMHENYMHWRPGRHQQAFSDVSLCRPHASDS